MRKKKVLVHGTADSLQKFFADEVSTDFEIVAILSDDDISSNFEAYTPQSLPQFIYELVYGVILTNPSGFLVKYFLKLGIEPRKIILWDAKEGWGTFNLPNSDGIQIIYFCGLEFHIRNEEDVKFFNETHWRLQRQRGIQKSKSATLSRIFIKRISTAARQVARLK